MGILLFHQVTVLFIGVGKLLFYQRIKQIISYLNISQMRKTKYIDSKGNNYGNSSSSRSYYRRGISSSSGIRSRFSFSSSNSYRYWYSSTILHQFITDDECRSNGDIVPKYGKQ
nr:hypothetical protein [Cronobacter malonaticus]